MRRSPCLLLSRTLPLDLGQASIPESNAFAICKSNLSNGSPLRFDDNGRPDLWSYLSENLSQKWPNRLVLFHAFIVHLFHLAMRRGAIASILSMASCNDVKMEVGDPFARVFQRESRPSTARRLLLCPRARKGFAILVTIAPNLDFSVARSVWAQFGHKERIWL